MKKLLLLAGLMVVLAGCESLPVRGPLRLESLSMDDLMRQVGSAGKVLVYGSAVGDINAFTVETDDGRQYQVSQLAGDGKVRLFYFLDSPRSFTVARVLTQPGNEAFAMDAGYHVVWKGRVGDGWIDSNSLYIGRVELSFGDPKHFAKIRGRAVWAMEQDRRLLQETLKSALHVADPPLAAQAP